MISRVVLCVPRVCSVHRGQKKELDSWHWSCRWLQTALRMLHPDPGPMGRQHVISTAEPSLRMNALSLTSFANSDSSRASWRVVSFPFPLFVSSCWLLYFSYLEYVCLFIFFLTLILTNKSTLRFWTHALRHLLESITRRAVCTTLASGHRCMHQVPF